ncbi:unnamed protein product [Thelazia callipaeda]|uniref:Pre-mRNA-splicing factor CWC22 homolog n=1 Tax=Thelazia callipaeda TaxID=103827 RepID=A0A0N5CU64_THECL|nr:unnamed protein product [Thelazia callipaeda]
MDDFFDDLICLDEEGDSEDPAEETMYVTDKVLKADADDKYMKVDVTKKLVRETAVDISVEHGKFKHLSMFKSSPKLESQSEQCGSSRKETRHQCDRKQGSKYNSTRISKHEKTESRKNKVKNTDNLPNVKGDASDGTKSVKDSYVLYSSRKEQNGVGISYGIKKENSSLVCDGKDWHSLCDDVREDSVRLAASTNESVTEKAKEHVQQKWKRTEKIGNKSSSQHRTSSSLQNKEIRNKYDGREHGQKQSLKWKDHLKRPHHGEASHLEKDRKFSRYGNSLVGTSEYCSNTRRLRSEQNRFERDKYRQLNSSRMDVRLLNEAVIKVLLCEEYGVNTNIEVECGLEQKMLLKLNTWDLL